MVAPAPTPPAFVDRSPLAAAAALRGRRGRVLLHSGRDDDGCGVWSFVAADPVATLEVRGRRVVERGPGGAPVADRDGDPIAAIAGFAARHGAALAGPAAAARLVRDPDGRGGPRPRVLGYLGYDLGRAIERLGPGPAAGADTPDAWLGAYPAVVRWAGAAGSGTVIAADPEAGAALAAAIAAGPALPDRAPRLGRLSAGDDGDDGGAAHRARVERIRAYIAAGDVYQVNLARRLTAPVLAPGDPLALYAALAAVAPAPYGGLIEADGVTVVSGSPERFLARPGAGARLDTRPIKGTRRRTGDPAADRALAADLAVHPKDGAEHLMIVDLERNDLGRVARLGTVVVDDLGYVVELPALYHKVSTVSCLLRPGVGWAELLRATFPGGSITGAPKIRAMEIIDELEPVRRGPYCGAFGWMGEGGALELAIAIRIAVVAGDQLRVHVGGGIVADSDPEAELIETEDKAAGWRAALDALAGPATGSGSR